MSEETEKELKEFVVAIVNHGLPEYAMKTGHALSSNFMVDQDYCRMLAREVLESCEKQKKKVFEEKVKNKSIEISPKLEKMLEDFSEFFNYSQPHKCWYSLSVEERAAGLQKLRKQIHKEINEAHISGFETEKKLLKFVEAVAGYSLANYKSKLGCVEASDAFDRHDCADLAKKVLRSLEKSRVDPRTAAHVTELETDEEETEDKIPVTVVQSDTITGFEHQCKQLHENGYVLKACNAEFVDSEGNDSYRVFQAIWAPPTV